MMPSPAEIALIDRWQRNFPLVERPFAVVGQMAGLDEDTTIETFHQLRETGVISRIGAVVRPHTIGASTLAAMQVPPDRLDEVAAIVSREPLVSHNYERAHPINLWFVIAGPNAGAVAATIKNIEKQAGIPVLDLPLIQAYHLDLGFSLVGDRHQRRDMPPPAIDYCPDAIDLKLLAAIEDGLPMVKHAYQEVASRLGIATENMIDRLEHLIASGIVTRFGCVVRHRALGYTANAMAVWSVPDHIVDNVASRFVQHPRVTLCYRRPRRLPDWPYNLFCMIHAKARQDALAVIDDLNCVGETGLNDQTVLFSTRCFKQRGAMFSSRTGGPH
jgi:DNA-binding Lrp family transcriptional regulator